MGKHISHIKSNLTVDSYINKETGAVVGADFYKLLPSDEQSKFELTTSPKLPTSEQLADGEIAINYAADYETISLKNNLSDIVTFKPDTYNSEKYATNAYVRENLGEIITNKDDLTAIAEAEGDNGVLTKTTNGDTATWSYTDQLYAQGTAQDLNAGTDTAEKVWDAKTIADYVQGTVNTLPEPMVFKGTLGTGGTISSLPEASSTNEGFTYKVITDGRYAGQKAKIGDLFISNGTAWNLVPSGDEPSGTVTNVATGTGLTGGPITTSGTISHADTSSQASVSNSGRTYIQSVTLDGMGHVTGLSSATEMVVNTDRYVNNAAFADDSTSTPASPVKMTLTRTGSDTATVTANLPKVSSESAGVAPKGAAVTTQSQSTKFLREDGTWAAPSYTKPGGDVTGPSSSTDAHVAVFNGGTGKVIKDSGFTIGKSVPSNAAFTDTDTKVTSVDNHYTPTGTETKSASGATGTAGATVQVVTGVTVDAKGHVTGVKSGAATDTDTKVTSVDNHYTPETVSGQDKSASASDGTAGWSIDVVKGVTLNTDGKGHVTGLSVTSAKIPENPTIPNAVTGTGLKVDKIVVGNEGSKVKTSDKGITATAPSSSSDDSTVPTSKAVWTAVSNGIATADAMIYKGTVAGGSTGAYGALTPVADKGWTYKVTTAGKIDGKAVEIGDMLICNTDGTAAATSSNYSTIAANWDVIQVNIDGAVTGPSSSTDAHVAVFSGGTGKVIKDSNFTIGKSVPSDAVFTDTTYSSKSAASGGTDVSLVTTGEKYTWNNKQNKVGKLGSTTKPVYISADGKFTECSTYAGGTAVTLNGNSKAGSTASFYAPTDNGEIGQFLMSTGSSIYPAWTFLDKTYLPSDTVYGTGLTAGQIVVGDGDSKVKTSGFTIGKSVPSDAVFTDTHYVTHLYAGEGTAANAETTNGNTKLTVVDDTTPRDSVRIKGTGGTTVTSDANGVVTINSTDVSYKQFTFDSPSVYESSYDFIILPNGYKACSSGTCYFVEITALIQKQDSWATRYVKFMTHCKWYAYNAGLRITEPVCTYGPASDSPILYHNKAEGVDVGTETRDSNICIIPFNIPVSSGIAAVNIKVEGPDVSGCICDRGYGNWKWSSVEPNWTFA